MCCIRLRKRKHVPKSRLRVSSVVVVVYYDCKVTHCNLQNNIAFISVKTNINISSAIICLLKQHEESIFKIISYGDRELS